MATTADATTTMEPPTTTISIAAIPTAPQYQPQMPPPKKKSRKGLFIVLGVILTVALVGCIGVVALVNAGGQAFGQSRCHDSDAGVRLWNGS